MQLSNKQTIYTCVNTQDDLSLNGTVHLNETNRVTQFNGNFTIDGEYAGDFYYSETTDGKINKSINNIPETHASVACDFVMDTVAEIKTELSN